MQLLTRYLDFFKEVRVIKKYSKQEPLDFLLFADFTDQYQPIK